MEKTTVYLPGDLRARLRETSKRLGLPQAEIVRDAVEKYLADRPRPWPKSIGSMPGLAGNMSAVEAKKWAREQMVKDFEKKMKTKRRKTR
jgi:hypothetical protein